MFELTAIAEAALVTAVHATGGAEALAVVGMGKLGGRELELLVGRRRAIRPPRHRLGCPGTGEPAAAALIALLSDATADGVALRVDPNLRPEGRAGPLSRSLEAMRDHYARHAATWEKQALLKARPVAG